MMLCTNVTLTNFALTGSIGLNGSGGGMFINYCNGCTVSCVIYGNRQNSGAGISIAGGSSNTISGIISNNIATGGSGYGHGGGIEISGSSYNTISATITGNSTVSNGGGISITLGTGNTVSGIISGNLATGGNSYGNGGGGLYQRRQL